jgi:hypothetical protein
MQYAHYMSHTPDELHNVLSKRRMTEWERDHIKRIVAEQQAQVKSDNAKAKKLAFYWHILKEPLLVERKIVRSMLMYKKAFADERRIEAITAYAMVLDRLKSDFTLNEKHNKILPSQIIKEKNLPNGGIHWVDWVPLKVKNRVMDLFAEIPLKAKAKQKEPFVRRIPPELHAELRDRLYNRTEKELANEEREQLIEPIDERAERIGKMKKALTKLGYIAPHEPLPHTWHGLSNT